MKWANIVLKRGVDKDLSLWKWRKQVLDGTIDANRKDGTITVMDQTGTAVVMYSFTRAWPAKYSSRASTPGGNEILVKELEIAHEGFLRTQ